MAFLLSDKKGFFVEFYISCLFCRGGSVEHVNTKICSTFVCVVDRWMPEDEINGVPSLVFRTLQMIADPSL
jgi:hypothetical protein